MSTNERTAIQQLLLLCKSHLVIFRHMTPFCIVMRIVSQMNCVEDEQLAAVVSFVKFVNVFSFYLEYEFHLPSSFGEAWILS